MIHICVRALSWALVAALSTTAAAQSGLLGEYYDEANFTDLVETRVDATIDFTTWGDKPSGTAVAADSVYSERWTGYVRIESAGSWTFTTNSNDGVRLWVDGQLLIDEWSQHPAQLDSASIDLPVGWYPIRLEHFQQGGGVVIQLSFEGPGQPQVVIPSTHLGVTVNGSVPPQVDLGVDKIVVQPSQSLTLVPQITDPDSSSFTYEWLQLSGPPALFVDPTAKDAQVYGLTSSGVYGFLLRVTDEAGASSAEEVRITVVESGAPGGIVTGVTRVHHRVSVNFIGPTFSEGGTPNPFTHRRLDVLFVHLATGTPLFVPGFFAADGQAADTGATSGQVWRAHLTPELEGAWYYQASFRAGTDVAASLDLEAGTPTAFHGQSGVFFVDPVDLDAPGFLAEGRLRYDGSHHLKLSGSGRTFIKGGANSPENLLAYSGFDQTTPTHSYQPHVQDWNAGDPTWDGGKGKGLIGALNYLAGQGMNAVYFLTFNVAGDGADVWPWTSSSQRERFDVSKLDQWEIVFDHMDRLGLMLHVVTQETENDDGGPALDGGELELERKLYYRELIARFGHHLGVMWNLGEENTNETDEQLDFYEHFVTVDPYRHPVVLHTFPSSMDQVYGPLLEEGALEGASLQISAVKNTHELTLFWRSESAAQGEPWVVSLDEIGPANAGVVPDSVDSDHDTVRQLGLWGNLMAGGGGVEWYFGYGYPNDDLDCEDWRSRENMWEQTRYAIEFFEGTSYEKLVPSDQLITGDNWCTADAGSEYVGYLPDGGSASITIAEGVYDVRWHDPRNGGGAQVGSVASVTGPGPVSIGLPPSATNEDWAVHLARQNSAPVIQQLLVVPDIYEGTGPLAFYVVGDDPDGVDDVEQVLLSFFSPAGTPVGGTVPPPLSNGQGWGLKFSDVTGIPLGTWTVVAEILDSAGNVDTQTTTFKVR